MASVIQSTGLYGSIANIYLALNPTGAPTMKGLLGQIQTKGLYADSVAISDAAKALFEASVAVTRIQQYTQASTDTSGPIASLREATAPGFDTYAEVPEDNVVIFGSDSVANQKYDTREFARVWTGSGNDAVTFGFAGEAFTGDGNDSVSAADSDATLVDLGAGDDVADVGHDGVVYAGSGNDTVVGKDRTQIDGGEGDDSLTAGENGVVVGGAGIDSITLGAGGYAQGDTGDDSIAIGGAGGTVYLDEGDGSDTVTASGPTNFKFGAGLTTSKLRIELSGDDLKISFDGSNGDITFKNYKGSSSKLIFADGTEFALNIGS